MDLIFTAVPSTATVPDTQMTKRICECQEKKMLVQSNITWQYFLTVTI